MLRKIALTTVILGAGGRLGSEAETMQAALAAKAAIIVLIMEAKNRTIDVINAMFEKQFETNVLLSAHCLDGRPHCRGTSKSNFRSLRRLQSILFQLSQ